MVYCTCESPAGFRMLASPLDYRRQVVDRESS